MAPESSNSLEIAFSKGLQLAFPPVMVKLLRTLLQPSPSFTAIAGYLKMDALLTGRILHIVNTSAYGFNEKVTDLERAVIIMGTNELFKLVLSLSLQKNLNPVHKRNPDLAFGDWRLTFWSAMAAEAIAARLCPKARHEAYLIGMLKDLPLFLAFCQNDVPPFLTEDHYATLPREGQFAEEMINWGQSHPEMARNIFQYWGFSDEMSEAVAVHHDYDNISAYPPLVRSVIYATRWAELLHAHQADMPSLFLFEMNMAAELGLSADEMSDFRASCAERFNRLLEQLDIQHSEHPVRLHDQSLSHLQSHYFLALGTLGRTMPESSQAFAPALQRQLRLIWNLKDWDLSISLRGGDDKSLFRCRGDHCLMTDMHTRNAHPPKADWLHIPIVCGKRDFGALIVPPQLKLQEEETSLPMFMSMLGLLLEERRNELQKHCGSSSFKSLPFVIARLDGKGHIRQASDAFLDVFKLNEVPKDLPVNKLLNRHLGIDLPPLEKGEEDGMRSGFFLSVPEGHFPGTPLYISRVAAPDNSDQSYLFIGDVTRMNSQQALAMAHQSLLGALFETLNEQVCLLDEEGRIVWTDESSRELLGRNIFNLSKPDLSSPQSKLAPGSRWDKTFLRSLASSTKVQAMLALGGTLIPYTLIFSPLEGKADRQYLLMLHLSPPAQQSAAPEPQKPQVAKAKDSLTDLYGYSQFHMLLKYATEQARKQDFDTGIIFCDIEGLHKFNALHGCQKGDMMLRRVAGCLAENCRPGQDHASRYGSDKFAVVIYRASRELLEGLAVSIHKQVKERCSDELLLNIGLVLVAPEGTPKTRLDAARRAAERASSEADRTAWAD